MLEKIKTFGLWFLIAIAIIGSVVYYYNVKYRDVTESTLLMVGILKL